MNIPRHRTLLALSAIATLVLAGAPAVSASDRDGDGRSERPTPYYVGIASRSINPDADGTFAGKPVYLGGYGVTNGSVTGPVTGGPRRASGILGPGVTTRAIAVAAADDPSQALVIVTVETQGSFVAYQQGDYHRVPVHQGSDRCGRCRRVGAPDTGDHLDRFDRRH